MYYFFGGLKMRKLCKAEIAVLKKYGFLEEKQIEKAEYDDILDKIPYYVFIKNNDYYKYEVPEDVTAELIEQLERAENLDLQIEINKKIKNIQEDVNFFKVLIIISLILSVIGACFSFFTIR